ncbi:MAG: thioredoxin domain-containing protein [Pseudomonadota bacterium]|uniref:thioredoxin domain-containing protein n=1 Tax=Sphingomonas sp. ERG5 TaxID=1381597 RepID=UPI00054C32D5|nr:thioredoxin domain-containing protein [Sphingomonas sp. ERG5]
MKFRLATAILPLIALAGCGSGNSTGNLSAPATPIAAIAAPAGQNWAETTALTAEGGYRLGNPNAPIKLVEYGSRTCPTCGQFGREGMEPLIKNYVSTGKVSYEFRDFLVHGAPDLAAALLGTCGGPQPFFPLLEQMYQNQTTYLDKLQKMSPEAQAKFPSMKPNQVATALAEQMGLIEFVKQRGIPEDKARACLNDQAKLEAAAKLSDDATSSGKVTGTPTFLVNDQKVDAVAWSQLEPILKGAGG